MISSSEAFFIGPSLPGRDRANSMVYVNCRV